MTNSEADCFSTHHAMCESSTSEQIVLKSTKKLILSMLADYQKDSREETSAT